MRNFLIGYGSLISQKSLKRTLPQVTYVEPLYIKNYQRSWSAIENTTSTFSTTYLGVEKCSDVTMNGIIFEVDESLLPTLDKREFLYRRKKVSIEDLEFHENRMEISSEDHIWIYITKHPIIPSTEFPMEDFAVDFICGTQNWSQERNVKDKKLDLIILAEANFHRPDSAIYEVKKFRIDSEKLEGTMDFKPLHSIDLNYDDFSKSKGWDKFDD